MDAPEAPQAVEYPVSDGEPMAETDDHRDAMLDAIETLRTHFADDPEVYVSGNNFVYYTEGVPRDVVSPDAYVVRGVAKHNRDTFKVWEEGGRRPCFVLEVTSKKTRRNDLGAKMSRYRDDLRVPEYFLFDPYGEWIPERLRGFRLRGGVYQPIAPRRATDRLPSRQLGLELGLADGLLRFFPPGAERPLPAPRERVAEAERRASQAERRASRAEAEAARLRAELERLRGEG